MAGTIKRDKYSGKELDVDDIKSEAVDVETTPASYHVKTDETDIVAIPQQKPADPSMIEVTGQDVGTVLEEIIVNQLPPQGSRKEGRGKIMLGAGDYPGTLSQVPLPAQLVIEGQQVSHWTPTSGDAGRPQVEAPTTLRGASGVASFVTPEVDNDDATYIRLSNIELLGPGAGDAGSIALDGNTANNPWDWFITEGCVFQRYETPIDILGLDNVFRMRDCHVIEFGSGGSGRGAQLNGGKMWITGTNFWTNTACDDMLQTRDGEVKIRDCAFALSSGAAGQPATAYLECVNGRQQYVHGCDFVNGLGSGGGAMLKSNNAEVRAVGNIFIDNSAGTNLNGIWQAGGGRMVAMANGFQGPMARAILAKGSGSDDVYYFNVDDGGMSNESISIDGNGGMTDAVVYNPGMQAGVNRNADTRTRFGDTVFLGGAPTASNYGANDAGTKILDTSVAPPDEYYVDPTGSVLGPL